MSIYVRDLSVIETPQESYPIQVCHEKSWGDSGAIELENGPNGQVFFIQSRER